MLVLIKRNYEEMSKAAADIVEKQIRLKPDSVLGLATGSTPVGTYKELINRHKGNGLDFSKITTFNLDEYVGLPPSHDQSYHYFMEENLFKNINVRKGNIYIPAGIETDIEQFCCWYEEKIEEFGGIDLQVLGIGSNGHIAFNEPGSSLGSRTRIKTLTRKTREDNARFFKSMDEVPKFAITMGVGTIMEAKKLLLLANGKGKAEAIKNVVEGPITAQAPATIVQYHPDAVIVADEDAVSLLETRDYWLELQESSE